MSTTKRFLLFILLPVIALLSYPPSLIGGGILLIAIMAALFVLLGWALWTGRNAALTFSIFLHGINVVVRTMMFFSQAIPKDAPANIPFIITSIIGIALSMYLLLRLDMSDVRITMTR